MKKAAVTILAFALVIILARNYALAEKAIHPHGAPSSPPQWAPIPQVPGVEYAPNIVQDLFRHQGRLYNYQGGAWFRGTTANGPWVQIQEPPQVFYNIQAPYFKVPPGWAKGKKTGWGGEGMPPGQMKKGR